MKYVYLVFLLLFFGYILKDYVNFILAIIVFSYFSEVFIDIFSNLKQKILTNLQKRDINDSKFIKNFKGFVFKFLTFINIDIAFIYLFYLVCLFLIIFVIIPPVFSDLKNIFAQLINNLPTILNDIKNYISNNRIINNFLLKNNINLLEAINNMNFNELLRNYADFIQKVITYILNFITSNLSVLFLIFVPLFSIYFLKSKEDFKRWIFENFSYIKEVEIFINSYDKYQKLYFKAILVNIFFIIFFSALVFYFIFGLKGTSLGILYGMFSFIPVVGPILGSLPAIILAFSKSISLGISIIIIVFIIQQLSDNFIMPKIIKDHLNLNPLITIFSILGFSSILGVWAVFISPPLVLTIKDLIEFTSKNKNQTL
jgi:predicted PurR-regulated permease PerM